MTNASSAYRINGVTKNDGLLTIIVGINWEHPLFSGHFPGNPVMPGVLNIEILQDALMKEFPEYVILEIPGIKFLKPVRPSSDSPLSYELKISEGKEDLRISCAGKQGETVFVKIQMKLIKR